MAISLYFLIFLRAFCFARYAWMLGKTGAIDENQQEVKREM